MLGKQTFIVLMSSSLLVGVWLLQRALWPPRVGATPNCRRCRYNLTGSGHLGPGARCPECGAALENNSAVVFGVRHKSWRKACIGGALALAALTALALMAYREIPSWEKWYPTSFLIDCLDDPRRRVIATVTAELSARYKTGMSKRNIRRLATTCLRIQSEPNRPAFDASLNLLSQLHWGHDLAESERGQYYEQLLGLRLLVRQRTPADRPLVVQLSSFIPMLYSPDFTARLAVRISWPSPLLDGASMDSPTERDTTWGGGIPVILTHEALVDVPGLYQLTTKVQVEVFESMVVGGKTITQPYSFTLSFAESVEVMPHGADAIAMVRDASLEHAMIDAVSLEYATIYAHRRSGAYAKLILQAGPLPVALATSVYVEGDGGAAFFGEFLVPVTSPPMALALECFEPDLPAPPWTIVLRPDLGLAYQDPAVDAIWGEEIRIENVTPVEYTPPQ